MLAASRPSASQPRLGPETCPAAIFLPQQLLLAPNPAPGVVFPHGPQMTTLQAALCVLLNDVDELSYAEVIQAYSCSDQRSQQSRSGCASPTTAVLLLRLSLFAHSACPRL